MGCCASRTVTDFPHANTKKDLKHAYNHEINRIKLLRHTIKVDPNKSEDNLKYFIIDKILHEDNWVILPLIESCREEHVVKIKFLLLDYFQVTENWNRKDFENNFIKLMNFYKDNSYQIKIIRKYKIFFKNNFN